MEGKEQIIGLSYDLMVFNHMKAAQSRDKQSAMNMAEATRDTGLNDSQIRRAVTEMRVKGYPVIATSTRRTWENHFRIASDRGEYTEWRNKLMADISALQEILRQCDRAAEHHFGKLETQGDLF